MNVPTRHIAPMDPFREKVTLIIYWLFMLVIIAGMVGSMTLAGSVLYYFYTGAWEPKWIAQTIPLLEIASKLFNPVEGDASKVLDSLYILTVALVMGVFLRRCSSKTHSFEMLIVIFFFLSGILQLSFFLALPLTSEARQSIAHGEVIVRHLALILSRNANIALAIFGAAMGIQVHRPGEGAVDG